jgi:predicted RNA-binding protein with PUA-like domain
MTSAERRYWLMKCEASAYTIDDLRRDRTTSWEGVRNFQARNFLRDMKHGDGVLFYASNADPSGVTGLAKVSREAYPDSSAFDRKSHYYDPKSRPEKPSWWMVDLRFVEKLSSIATLDELRRTTGLESMQVLRKGNRLSVQPVTREEYDIVVRLGRRGPAA